MRIPFILAAIAVLAAPPTFAQADLADEAPPKKIREIYLPVENLGEEIFNPAEVDGDYRKATGMRISSREEGEFPSMIDERVHFKRALAKSAGFGPNFTFSTDWSPTRPPRPS